MTLKNSEAMVEFRI